MNCWPIKNEFIEARDTGVRPVSLDKVQDVTENRAVISGQQ